MCPELGSAGQTDQLGGRGGPPVRRQTRLDVRDLRGGNTWGRVGGGIAAVAGGVASGGNSAHYGPGVFCDLAVLAAALNGSVLAQVARAWGGGEGTRVHNAGLRRARKGGRVHDDHSEEEKALGAGGNQEDMRIAFAASGAGIKIKSPHMGRWGTGTGYRMVGNSGIRTPGRSEDVRTLAFVMSLSVHNSWAMVCAAARLATRGGRVTQAEFRPGMVMEMIASVPESRPEPEPPPAVAP